MLTILFRSKQPLMAIGGLALLTQCAYADLTLPYPEIDNALVEDNSGFAALLSAYDYHQPSASICDYHENVKHGMLCAIRPSRLDGDTRDVFAADTLNNRRLGFGYHAIMFPNENVTINGVYIHFGGTFSRPYNQRSRSFTSTTLLNEAAEAGFIAIQLAYNNRFLVSGVAECNGATGRFIDNCAGGVRRDKTIGGNVSPSAPTPIADSIEHRLIRLLEYLDNQGFVLPVQAIQDDHIAWSELFLGGHSQGATQALYIGKYFGAKHVCMLAGGFDVPDNVPAPSPLGIADWLTDLSATIPRHKLRAIVAEDDSFIDQFLTGYDVMLLVENWHWRSFYADHYVDAASNAINGHSAAVGDPNFAELRRKACFTRRYLWSPEFLSE